MFENVLVGVDGRPNGRDAITLAGQLVDRAGRLTLAHVHSGGLDPGQRCSLVVLPRRGGLESGHSAGRALP